MGGRRPRRDTTERGTNPCAGWANRLRVSRTLTLDWQTMLWAGLLTYEQEQEGRVAYSAACV